jgi:cell division protease FtsH
LERIMSDNDDVSARATGWPRPVDGENEFDLAGDEDRAEELSTPRRRDAAECLIGAALDRAAAAIVARLTTPEPLAVVVRVPTYGRLGRPDRGDLRETGPTPSDLRARREQQDRAQGRCGQRRCRRPPGRRPFRRRIASSLATLPRALTVAADASIEIKIDAGIVSDAVARFVGGPPVAETIDGLESLDFHDLVSAFRPGSSAAEIYARLPTAAARLSRPFRSLAAFWRRGSQSTPIER